MTEHAYTYEYGSRRCEQYSLKQLTLRETLRRLHPATIEYICSQVCMNQSTEPYIRPQNKAQ